MGISVAQITKLGGKLIGSKNGVDVYRCALKSSGSDVARRLTVSFRNGEVYKLVNQTAANVKGKPVQGLNMYDPHLKCTTVVNNFKTGNITKFESFSRAEQKACSDASLQREFRKLSFQTPLKSNDKFKLFKTFDVNRVVTNNGYNNEIVNAVFKRANGVNDYLKLNLTRQRALSNGELFTSATKQITASNWALPNGNVVSGTSKNINDLQFLTGQKGMNIFIA